MEPQEYYKFCPQCKSELTSQGGNSFRLKCPNCGYLNYIDPIPVNALIIHDINKGLLLAKRKNDPQKDMWDLTGGFVNLEETIEQSVIREAKEELGIDIPYFKYFRSYPQRYLYKGTNLYVLAFVYFIKEDFSQTKITPADDVSEAEYFALDKIPWREIAFGGIKQALKDYLNQL
jgi:NADH pyrophosphatase NudC (nudix superfamily)